MKEEGTRGVYSTFYGSVYSKEYNERHHHQSEILYSNCNVIIECKLVAFTLAINAIVKPTFVGRCITNMKAFKGNLIL